MKLKTRKGKRFAIRSGHFAKHLRAQFEIREAALVMRMISGMPTEPVKKSRGRKLNNPTHPRWKGGRGEFAQKEQKRALLIEGANALNPTLK